MTANHIEEAQAALEHLNPVKKEGRGCRNQCQTPDLPVIDEPDSWLAPDLLEMLMATVRIGLDGQEVVNLAVLSPELYGDKECFWSLDQLPKGILPQRRADD